MRKIVIIGATSAIAQHCARDWLRSGPADILLCGRDAERLERVAADLRVRSAASTIAARVIGFDHADEIAAAVAQACAQGAPDIALIAHGLLPDQQQCQSDLPQAEEALRVNGVSPVLFAEAFAGAMQRTGRGTLIVIGSVAGDRGRRKNYVYGAAKALVDRYVEGLQHRFAGSQVKVVLAKPGPTQTPMTAHMPAAKLAPVEDVARAIVEGAARGAPVIYAPARWRLIMLVLRHLPRAIFDKLDI